MKPTLLIYRSELLPSSETFILAQGESTDAFRPVYVGLRQVAGLEVPAERCVILGPKSLRRLSTARFRLWGPTRSEVAQLKSKQPAIIHAHFGMDAVEAMPLARSLGIPLVVTFHGWDATVNDHVFRRQSLSLNLYVKRQEALNRAARRIVCVSEFIREKVIAKGFSPEKTTVHYIGIDIQKFTPDLTVTRKPIVLFVGRLVEKKGCEYLIRAMEKVQATVSAEVVIIGDGPLCGKLEREAAGRLQSFRFLGGCPAEVVHEWMNRATVFSTPSVVAPSGDAEGFGMVFVEAQAMGLPVASFASGGIPEAVEHGVTGLLAPECDVDALANNISMLLTNPSLWQRFSAAGRERAARMFDLQRQTAKLETIYQEVLEEHQPKPAYASLC